MFSRLDQIDVERRTIGLRRGIVELVTHDPSWKKEFLKEKEIILSAVSASVIRIDHVGSTAIPGIKAKPLIDIEVTWV